MAGIGFELRKLFREQGLINNVKAYAYSSLTTVGPMILCMVLIIALQRIMDVSGGTYLDWQLYIATVSYCFVFSIMLTSGISMVLTRYIADHIYGKNYNRLMSSYYGSLIIMLPLASLIAIWFLSGVTANMGYKIAAYFFFNLLIIIWIQGVYLSALKDYIRIARGFMIGSIIALLTGWLCFIWSSVDGTTAALIGLDLGFLTIVILSFFHFEQRFPRGEGKYFFEFVHYFKKYSSLFFAGCFIYSGVYLHNFIYWLSPRGTEVADRFLIMPFYDLPVYFAFMSVMPTLVTFVVSVETSFYEKFRMYYMNILNGGTIQDIAVAKKDMQKTLMKEISFLMEIQLLFTVLAIALGVKFLPQIGFTAPHLDLFIILTLAYYLFITMFVLTHVLMYFDDRKGVLLIGISFVLLNIGFTYWMMEIEKDGLGMFIASFIALLLVFARLLYVLRNIDYYTFCAQPIHQAEKTKQRSFFHKSKVITSVIVMTIVLSACSVTGEGTSDNTEVTADKNRAEVSEQVSSGLNEDKRLYERDEDDSLKTLYITILPDKSTDAPALDWYSLNRLENKSENKKLNIIMQEGLSDGEGPRSGMFGYGATSSNANITLRGNTAWYTPQKSYRIKLQEEAGMYLDQRSFNLNKHSLDLSRLRNKLSFDLFENIPNMTSLRTQFVHLYVKDLSAGAAATNYVDYGLYTHVEQPNKQFLRSHMLDPNGYLYKVTFFEYNRYPDQIKNYNDPAYNKESFETILEIKGREDHTKLIDMLDDVNDYSIPIDEVVSKHFDLDNFLTWTAANILMDNMDTDANNFYLYSPLNEDKWYILPWDYDGGWELQRRNESIRPFQAGISNYWGSVLHNRYFRSESHIQQLKDKLEQLYAEYINADTIKSQLDQYEDIVKPFLTRNPDIQFLPDQASKFDEDLSTIMNTPENGLKRFLEDLEKPKPFFQNDVEQYDGQLHFSWDISFDLQDDALEYEITIAKDPGMSQVVFKQSHLKGNSLAIKELSAGLYYWKAIVTDAQGNMQYSFDTYIDEDRNYYQGMREFEVK